MKFRFLFFLLLSVLCTTALLADEAWERVQKTGELRWGGDAAGGAPYVFPDADQPDKLIGFEIDLLDALAARLNVKAKFVSVQWDQLVPALLRDDFDAIFNGLEVTQDRLQAIDFSIPYYFFSNQITVRAENQSIRTFNDLRGKKVGTLSATLAHKILEETPRLGSGQAGKITAVGYPSPVEAYRDLEIGRLDAVFMDVPIAAFYAAGNPKLKNLSDLAGDGIYASGVRKDSPQLKVKINDALIQMIQSGELKKIYLKWNMWNEKQDKLADPKQWDVKRAHEKNPVMKFSKLLLLGAGMTLILSFLSMGIAVIVGSAICAGKLYGNFFVRAVCNVYVEVIRGTPLLIQLYLLYYGLPNLGIQLPAFAAAILGLGFNYAAYEAEIYRAGLLSLPKGQEEAARSLGMTGWQAHRFVLVPQAVRTILPPSTNDFIALFKDTSLVSIITVMELTRAYTTAATTTYRFLELGLATAALYFLMSFPLSLWSRRMENQKHASVH